MTVLLETLITAVAYSYFLVD